MRRRRGVALAVTLMCLLLMALFLELAFGATDVTNRVEQRYLQAEGAEQSARAGLAAAMQAIQADPAFRGDVTGQLTASGSRYTLTFNPAASAWSTNNLLGISPVTGYQGRVVPAGCCHLVSTGQAGQAIGRAEVMLRLDPTTPGQFQILSRWGE